MSKTNTRKEPEPYDHNKPSEGREHWKLAPPPPWSETAFSAWDMQKRPPVKVKGKLEGGKEERVAINCQVRTA